MTSLSRCEVLDSCEITEVMIKCTSTIEYIQRNKRAQDQKNAISMQILAAHIQIFSYSVWFFNGLYTLLNLLIYLCPSRYRFCHFLVRCLDAAFVHWPECTGCTGLLLHSPVLLTLFIYVTSCPFASSSSVLCRDTDALDSGHIWVAPALIVCQPLRQHH